MAEPAPLARLEHAEAAHVLDVGARDERPLAGTRQNDDPGRIVVRQVPEPGVELRQRLEVERVQRIRAVDREDGDAVQSLERERYAASGSASRSRRNVTISLVGAPGVKTSATP